MASDLAKIVTLTTLTRKEGELPALLWSRVLSWIEASVPRDEVLALRDIVAAHVNNAAKQMEASDPTAIAAAAASSSSQAKDSKEAAAGTSGSAANSGAAYGVDVAPHAVSFQYTSQWSGSRLAGHIIWMRLGQHVALTTLVLSPTVSAEVLLTVELDMKSIAAAVHRVCGAPSTGVTAEMLSTSNSRLSAIGCETFRICQFGGGSTISELVER